MLSLITTETSEPDVFTIDPPTRSRLSSSMRRALQMRVDALGEEQRAAAEEFEWHYDRQDEILAEMMERQQRCRQMREILLADGAAYG